MSHTSFTTRKTEEMAALDEVIFDYIVAYCETHAGNSPVLDQIVAELKAQKIKTSRSGVYASLKRIVASGKIKRVARRIQVVGGRWSYEQPVISSDPLTSVSGQLAAMFIKRNIERGIPLKIAGLEEEEDDQGST